MREKKKKKKNIEKYTRSNIIYKTSATFEKSPSNSLADPVVSKNRKNARMHRGCNDSRERLKKTGNVRGVVSREREKERKKEGTREREGEKKEKEFKREGREGKDQERRERGEEQERQEKEKTVIRGGWKHVIEDEALQDT